MKAGKRLPLRDERFARAIGSMVNGTIGGFSKIGMPVIEVLPRPVPPAVETGTAVVAPTAGYSSDNEVADWEQASGDSIGLIFTKLYSTPDMPGTDGAFPGNDYVFTVGAGEWEIVFVGDVTAGDIDANARLTTVDSGGVVDTDEGADRENVTLTFTAAGPLDVYLHWDHNSPESNFIVADTSTLTAELS